MIFCDLEPFQCIALIFLVVIGKGQIVGRFSFLITFVSLYDGFKFCNSFTVIVLFIQIQCFIHIRFQHGTFYICQHVIINLLCIFTEQITVDACKALAGFYIFFCRISHVGVQQSFIRCVFLPGRTCLCLCVRYGLLQAGNFVLKALYALLSGCNGFICFDQLGCRVCIGIFPDTGYDQETHYCDSDGGTHQQIDHCQNSGIIGKLRRTDDQIIAALITYRIFFLCFNFSIGFQMFMAFLFVTHGIRITDIYFFCIF